MSLARMMAEEVSYRARVDSADQKPTLAGDKPVPAAIDQKSVDDALSVLTKYIPTEVIGLYLPGLAASSIALSNKDPMLGPKLAYWIFALGVTPIMVLVTYAIKRKAAQLPAWPSIRAFPAWRVLSAIVAFLTWALAIPNNPYVTRPELAVVWGFAAIFVSTILSLVEKLVQPGPSSPPAPAPAQK